jgi:hypothetical protein
MNRKSRLAGVYVIAVFLVLLGGLSMFEVAQHWLMYWHILPGDHHKHGEGILGIPILLVGICLFFRRAWALAGAWIIFGILNAVCGLGVVAGLLKSEWSSTVVLLGLAILFTCCLLFLRQPGTSEGYARISKQPESGKRE